MNKNCKSRITRLGTSSSLSVPTDGELLRVNMPRWYNSEMNDELVSKSFTPNCSTIGLWIDRSERIVSKMVCRSSITSLPEAPACPRCSYAVRTLRSSNASGNWPYSLSSRKKYKTMSENGYEVRYTVGNSHETRHRTRTRRREHRMSKEASLS